MATLREEAALVDFLRANGVHQALNEAILAVYVTGTRHPSEMLDEVMAVLGKERCAPKLGDVRLPLRSKDQFMTALNMSNLLAALKPGVAALEECRHAGEAMQPGEAVAVVRERAVGWHISRKVAVKKRQSAATAVVLSPPRRAVAAPAQPPQPLSPAGSVSDPEEEEGLAQALQEVTAAAEHAAAQEEAAMEAEAQQASENGQEAAQ